MKVNSFLLTKSIFKNDRFHLMKNLGKYQDAGVNLTFGFVSFFCTWVRMSAFSLS